METQTTEQNLTACPHCEVALTDEQIKQMWASYCSGRRETHGGRARVPQACLKCGTMCKTAREARDHCRLSSDPEQAFRSVKGRMPQFIADQGGNLQRTITGLQRLVNELLESGTVSTRGQVRMAKAYLALLER